jgi:Ulp1 protease family, C-terminal catalytic domain
LDAFLEQFGDANNESNGDISQHSVRTLQFDAFQKRYGNTTNGRKVDFTQNSVATLKIDAFQQAFGNATDVSFSQNSCIITKEVKPDFFHHEEHKNVDLSDDSYEITNTTNGRKVDFTQNSVATLKIDAFQQAFGNATDVNFSQNSCIITKEVKPDFFHHEEHKNVDLSANSCEITKVVPPEFEISEAILQNAILQEQLGFYKYYPSFTVEWKTNEIKKFHRLVVSISNNSDFMECELKDALLPITLVENDDVPLNTVVFPQFDTLSLEVPLRKLKLQLMGTAWLHCDLVNCWTIMLNHSYSRKTSNLSTFVASTYFYNKSFECNVYSFEKVQRWIRKSRMDEINADQFVIPIHINEVHWLLMVIKKTSKEIWLIDSLPNKNPGIYFNNLMRFWSDYMHSRGEGDIDSSQWKFVVKYCTQQDDFVSCGIFMCSSMLMLCNGCNDFIYPENWADIFRRYMVYCLHLPYLFTMENVCRMCSRWCVGNCSFCNDVN